MSKAILVIDMPKKCDDCPCINTDEYDTYCMITDNRLEWNLNYEYIKPDWCPLKPMPEYREIVNNYDDKLNGIDEGWNDCLNEILGE